MGALFDLKILRWNSVYSHVILWGTYLTIGTLWAFVYNGTCGQYDCKTMANNLHELPKYGSLGFVALESIWLLKNRKLLSLSTVTMVVAQLVGLWALQHKSYCEELGTTFGNDEIVWYTLSDTSLLLLLATYLISHWNLPAAEDIENENPKRMCSMSDFRRSCN